VTSQDTGRGTGQSGISVAMATYNGARFLEEQLESLAGQTALPGELVVGDDGSDDETPAILERFAAAAPFPVRITRNPARLGYGDNFLAAAERCRGPWIAFCDQDDVWLPHRLGEAAAEIGRAGPSLCLVIQGAGVVDEALTPLGQMVSGTPRRRVVGRLGAFAFESALGFCQTFRADLLSGIPWRARPAQFHDRDTPIGHDMLIAMLALTLGDTLRLPGHAALYRRHGGNVSAIVGGDEDGPQASAVPAPGASLYALWAERAGERAAFLDHAADVAADAGQARALADAAAAYHRLARGMQGRARLHRDASPLIRLAEHGRLWAHGHYLGAPAQRLGPRAALKDAARVLGLVGPS